MREGAYEDAFYPSPRLGKAKILAVICTFVPRSGIERDCPAFSSHGLPPRRYDEKKIETIKFCLAAHQHYNAGVDYDIVLVDNDSHNQEWLQYLKTLDIPHYTRSNVGFSFGAFVDAFEKYKNQYDYFLFCEQDAIPTKDSWLLDILQRFHSERDVGAVGNFVESRTISTSPEFFQRMAKSHPTLKKRDWMYNFDGFWSFTSTPIVEEAGTPFLIGVSTYEDIEDRATWNEMYFHQPILEKGYKLLSYFDEKHILWKGQYVQDHDPLFDSLPMESIAPLALAHIVVFDKRAKEHFSWYKP